MAPRRPTSDAGYLEAAARIIFMGGLNRAVVDAKWPGFRAAFSGFDVAKVASLEPGDVDRLAADERVIRHHAKLAAVVRGAEVMQELAAEQGSFDAYVTALLRAAGVTRACAELAARFAYISKDGARHWLYATGHDVGEVTDRTRAKYAPYSG
jgi:3-methyladenine DNA glycosylase Tag